MLKKNEKNFISFCSDINPNAIEISKNTLKNNEIENFDIILCNLIDPFLNKMKIDILLFNPPYVPSDKEELGFNDIRASYAGGKDGMEITNQLLPIIDV